MRSIQEIFDIPIVTGFYSSDFIFMCNSLTACTKACFITKTEEERAKRAINRYLDRFKKELGIDLRSPVTLPPVTLSQVIRECYKSNEMFWDTFSVTLWIYENWALRPMTVSAMKELIWAIKGR